MNTRRSLDSLVPRAALCAALLWTAMSMFTSGAALAQEDNGEEPEVNAATLLGEDELRALVAPVALYPDDLLALVLPASTSPFQIVQAQRFLDKQKQDPDLQPDTDWDPAVLALLNYPDVIAEMNADLDWTENLGNAVIDQQSDVMDMIQQIRAETYAGGYLQSNEQQVVVQEKETIIIQSSDPEVIYVPQYDPQVIVVQDYAAYPPVVYSDPYPYYYSPAATFWTGALVGATFAYAFDWFDDDIDIDCCDGNWGGNDIDIDRGDINIGGDVNIGSGNINANIKNGDRFGANRQQGSGQDKLTWNGKKSRDKSAKTKASMSTRQAAGVAPANKQGAASATKPATKDKKKSGSAQQVGSKKSTSQAGSGLGDYGTGQKTKKDSQKGNQSLQKSKQNTSQKKQTQGTSAKKKQSQGQGFGNVSNGKNTAKQSNRGNKSLNSSGVKRKKRG
jgi:hypothetical protein